MNALIAMARYSEGIGNEQEELPTADAAAAGGWSDVATVLSTARQGNNAVRNVAPAQNS